MDALQELFDWAEDNHYLNKTKDMINAASKEIADMENELATLRSRLQEADNRIKTVTEIINRVGDNYGKNCPICTGGINGWGHVQACYDLQNWAKENTPAQPTELATLRSLVREMGLVLKYFKKDKTEIHLCGPKECHYCGAHIMAYDSRHLIERCPGLQAQELLSRPLVREIMEEK